jgi:AcrR family transcriptional regulator
VHIAAVNQPADADARKRPKNRKAQLALAAAELFCERGYHGVGIDEIAAAVGISGPAVYRHFPNKYAVLVHATRELVDAVHAVVDDALDGPAELLSPQERLDRVLVGLVRLSVDRRKVAGLYQWEGRYLTPEHQAEFQDELSELVGRVARVVRELRPELTGFSSRLLTRAAFSVLSSPATHRAALNRARGEPLLQRAAWILLSTAAPVIAVPARPTSAAAATGSTGRARAASPPIGVSSRREILLTVAIQLFHQQGYHSVGMEDIGRAAGINASSVYRYFPSKADLLAAVYYRAAERVTAGTTASLAAAENLDDALRRLVEGYVDLTFQQTDLVAVYQAENNNLPESDRHELRKVQRLQVEEWVQLLVGIRPELAAVEARLLVHAALNLVTDLGASPQAPTPAGFEQPVALFALTVLLEG